MATYKVERGHIGAYENTLAANVVDVVEFGSNLAAVEISKDEGAAIYFTVDGTDPAVGGSHCYFLPADLSAAREVSSKANSASAGTTVVRLISVGTPTYSVARVSN